MRTKPFPCLLAFSALAIVFLGAAASPSEAQIFYDGTFGLPAGQGWSAVTFGATQTLTNNGVLLDTSASSSVQAGYSRTAPGLLNRTNGFTLLFTAQMISEAHNNASRAGFSIIVLADDARGVELGFWTNNIFAQSDSPLFTHAEDTNFVATSPTDYALTFHASNYVLSANRTTILSGPVRDYSAFSGFPNPYSTPDFLFFGDDTTSAAGAFVLKKVVLITAPQLVALSDKLIAWTGVSNQTYTAQSSSNLVNWTTVGTVASVSSNYFFTNSSSASPRFFRVTFP